VNGREITRLSNVPSTRSVALRAGIN